MEFEKQLEQAFVQSDEYQPPPIVLKGKWNGLVMPRDIQQNVDTGVNIEELKKVGMVSVQTPSKMVFFHFSFSKLYPI